jgi:N-acetylmuramoyl-L-alanine amidase
MGSSRTLIAALVLALTACAPLPQRAGIPTQWQPSPNVDERRPNFVIIHHTGSDRAERALRTLTSGESRVSAHYLIARDGTIYQIADERARAWHAGESYWGGNADLNSSSLGIELDNDGEEPFAEAQIAALLELLSDISQRYGIPAANFLGHGDVAPRRKTDPSRHFPWRRLAERGFGLWCDANGMEAPATLDSLTALQALGYDVWDAAAAIGAFRRRFATNAADTAELPDLTTQERALLHCLIERKRQ